MMIQSVLGIEPGITAVIGSGGKTSLIAELAGELCDGRAGNGETVYSGRCFGNVVICTTTHIMKPEGMPVYVFERGQGCADGESVRSGSIRIQGPGPQPETDLSYEACREKATEQLRTLFEQHKGSPVCVGTADPDNPAKLISFPIDIIREAAGKDAYIMVEADGAKHLPMKAHNDREPVIPEECGRVVLVIGAEGFGKPVSEAVHRPEIFAELADINSTEVVTPDILAKVLLAERPKYGTGRLQVLINRTDSPEQHTIRQDLIIARKLAELTGWEVYVGCVKKGVVEKV